MQDLFQIPEGLTFDDVLLVPGYADFLPDETDLGTRLTRRTQINVPVVSAAMDTVTEWPMAMALALEGGLGFIHRNMPVDEQTEQVAKIKSLGGIDRTTHPLACLDRNGNLMVGAAVGVGDAVERARRLMDAGVDVLAIDTAHGHSRNVMDALLALKATFPDLQVIAGNIATAQAARDLIDAGADGLKVGIGPGSICTTRVVAGVGVPQISAIREVYTVAKEHNVPIVADGGIQYSGDIVKALAAGADTVMLGGLLARTREAPGDEVEMEGRLFKLYRGMGSLGALSSGHNDRYAKAAADGGVVPEGIEGRVPLTGTVGDLLYQLLGGVRKGMGYCGIRTVGALKERGRFIRVSAAAMRESHPHHIWISKEAPNYSRVGDV